MADKWMAAFPVTISASKFMKYHEHPKYRVTHKMTQGTLQIAPKTNGKGTTILVYKTGATSKTLFQHLWVVFTTGVHYPKWMIYRFTMEHTIKMDDDWG